MKKMTTTRITILSAAAAIGSLIGVALAPHAHADTSDTDAAYLMTLSVDGIHSVYGTAGLLNVGHQVCALRLAGNSNDAVINYVYQTSALDMFDSGYLVGASESSYCPAMTNDSTGTIA
jgi:hypothetical protein